MSLVTCALLLLQAVLAADVVVTAGPPLDAQRLADALRAYLPEYGVRVHPDRAGVARDVRGQLAEARRVGEALRAVAVVRAQPASPERIQLNLVELATQQALVISVSRPERDADLYRALALKIQALLRSTAPPTSVTAHAGESRPDARRVGPGLVGGQATTTSVALLPPPPSTAYPATSTSSQAPALSIPSIAPAAPPPPPPAAPPTSTVTSSVLAAAPSPPVLPPRNARAPGPRALSSSTPNAAPSASRSARSASAAIEVLEAPAGPPERGPPGFLSLQLGYAAVSFPLNGPWVQGVSLTGMFAVRRWLDLSLGGAALSSARAQDASPSGYVTAVASFIPITAAARLRLGQGRYEFLAGPMAEVAIASVTTTGDAATPVRSTRNVMVGVGAEAEGRVRLGSAMWLYGRLAGVGLFLGQRYTVAGKPVLDMSRLEATAGVGLGFELR